MNVNLIFISALTIIVPSIQHYVPPPDMCFLSITCNHTWVPECGMETNTSMKRLFLDNCDMYEYNCDHNTEFIKIETKECPHDCTHVAKNNNYATEHTITTSLTSTTTTPVTSTTTTPATSKITPPVTSTISTPVTSTLKPSASTVTTSVTVTTH